MPPSASGLHSSPNLKLHVVPFFPRFPLPLHAPTRFFSYRLFTTLATFFRWLDVVDLQYIRVHIFILIVFTMVLQTPHSAVLTLCSLTKNLTQAQTPEQRMRNQKFAKENTARMGKPESAIKKKDKDLKSPISPIWLGRLPRRRKPDSI
jgi:hypothetical protein